MGRKRALIETLFRHGILTHLPTSARLTVLAYHRVRAVQGPNSPEASYLFDDSV